MKEVEFLKSNALVIMSFVEDEQSTNELQDIHDKEYYSTRALATGFKRLIGVYNKLPNKSSYPTDKLVSFSLAIAAIIKYYEAYVK